MARHERVQAHADTVTVTVRIVGLSGAIRGGVCFAHVGGHGQAAFETGVVAAIDWASADGDSFDRGNWSGVSPS